MTDLPVVRSFDYAALPQPAAERARTAADFIRERHGRITETILAIGARLLIVKADLEHGQFLEWVAAELNWSDRTAQNYMSAARSFGAENETISYLPPTTVYRLAAASEPIRLEVLSKIEAERPSTKEVDGLLTSARDAERERCLLYTSPSPRDATLSRMPSSA